MTTFISDKIRAIIDIENDKLYTSVSENCISITGDSLNISGCIPAQVKFVKVRKVTEQIF